MTTAVDSSVIIDILSVDPMHAAASAHALLMLRERGEQLVACAVVWAEVGGALSGPDPAYEFAELGITFDEMGPAAAVAAGKAWRAYRSAGGPCHQMIADFLVAGHALHHADQLLSRDRGAYRRYLPELRVLDPSAV